MIKNLYVDDHNVDSNYFFKSLFLPYSKFCLRKCFRCDTYCVTEREDTIHSFLSHYQHSGSRPTEFKPISNNLQLIFARNGRTKNDANLEKYFIDFKQHGRYYDLENSREIIEEFMTVFEQNFVQKPNGKKTLFKCSFTIVNFQPSPVQNAAEIPDSRTWTTKVYEGVYFNECLKQRIMTDVGKRIIINGLTGSSWRFKRFDRLSISVNTDDDQKILK